MCPIVSDKNSNKTLNNFKLKLNKEKKEEKLSLIRIHYSGFCAGLHDGKAILPL